MKTGVILGLSAVALLGAIGGVAYYKKNKKTVTPPPVDKHLPNTQNIDRANLDNKETTSGDTPGMDVTNMAANMPSENSAYSMYGGNSKSINKLLIGFPKSRI